MIKCKISYCQTPKQTSGSIHASNLSSYFHSSTIFQKKPPVQIFNRFVQKKVSVILLEDIDKLGIAGQEKPVSRGHFRNVLSPRKLAVVATPANRAKIPGVDKERLAAIEQQKKMAKASERLSKIVVRFKRQVLANGSLHAGVNQDNVVEKLKVQHAIDLQPAQVMLTTPIQSLGEHTIQIMIDNNSFPLKLKIDKR